MSDPGHAAAFLSYAKEDVLAALRICAALRAAGIEVWLDQSELTGGDSWDRKIRGQIGTCVLFAPMISAATQARREGYFRIEWKLAAQRTHAMADGTPFLLPIVIDGTKDSEALVPEEFRAVQWTRLPGGETSAAFCSRVKKLLESATASASSVVGAPLVGARGSPAPDGRRQATPLQKATRPWLVPVALAFAAIVALALWQPWKKPPLVATTAAKPAIDFTSGKSIAVLAFADLSADKGSEYFADGISEELLDVLGKVPGLRVVGRTSSFSFKGKNAPAAEIAQKLGVAYLVDGSVARDGTKVRIAARLINASDGFQLWSDKFTRELTDIFKLQDEIAGLIAKNLSLKLGASVSAKSVNPEVFRLYLEGRQEWNKRSPEGLDKAQALFERALALDPTFARAHAGLADVWIIRVTFFSPQPEQVAENLSHVFEGVDRALALDPNLAEAYATRGLGLYAGRNDQFAAATAAFQRALELNPNYATAHQWFGRLLSAHGKLEASLAEAELAARLDPLSAAIARAYGFSLGVARRWKESLAAHERALAIQPDIPALMGKADALIRLERRPEALAILSPLFEGTTGLSSRRRTTFVSLLAQAGDQAKAGELAKPIFADPTKHPADQVFYLYLALNRVEEGFAFLERSGLSSARGAGHFVAPVYDRVRDDPRFLRKLEEAGLLSDYRSAWAEYLAWKKKTGQP